MIDSSKIFISNDLVHLITPQQAWHYRIVPKQISAKNEIVLYITSKNDYPIIADELEMLLGREIILEAIEDEEIHNALLKYYRQNNTNSTSKKIGIENVKADDFLPFLISEARSLNSSDIHIEIYDEKCRIRIRVDGMLIERYQINKADYPTLINKIKIKANLDISEKRLPQDGRILFLHQDHKFDIRVSILPTLHGEKVVLRLLGNDASNININSLGFGEKELNNYLEGIKKPHGIVLISGPTGSGKTTTLYATLKILNNEKSNIVTIEDPIEYTLDGINQVQLKESIGLNFASALKSFLRQDPDVIMLGEIRDAETAQMAIRAALTGHLVLSTIHTNSAWGTISRLIDMGVPSFLLASTINLTVAQRLLRILCNNCKQETEFSNAKLPFNFKAKKELQTQYIAGGCQECYYTGYKGRKAIYEVIPIDYELAEGIKNNEFTIGEYTKKKQLNSLSDNAFDLFEKGQTSLDEIYPVLINNF